MNKNRTVESVQREIIQLGYIPMFEDIENVKNEKFKISSKEGYLSEVNIVNLRRNGNVAFFHKKNKYTIQNIKTWLKINNPSIILLSENYCGNKGKLKFKCKIDGFEWETSWTKIQSGHGCLFCTNSYQKTLDDLRYELWFRNRNLELLTTEVSKSYSRKTNVRCKICGHEWLTTYSNLIKEKNTGCPECAKELMRFKSAGFYNSNKAEMRKDEWSKIDSMVYIINCYDKNENFYKIGLTTSSIKERFSSKKKMPYKYSVIKIYRLNLYQSVILEEKLHDLNNKYTYLPKKSFTGETECFSEIISVLD